MRLIKKTPLEQNAVHGPDKISKTNKLNNNFGVKLVMETYLKFDRLDYNQFIDFSTKDEYKDPETNLEFKMQVLKAEYNPFKQTCVFKVLLESFE